MDADKVEKLVAELKEKQGAFDQAISDYTRKEEARQTAYAAMQAAEQERDKTRDALARALNLK